MGKIVHYGKDFEQILKKQEHFFKKGARFLKKCGDA